MKVAVIDNSDRGDLDRTITWQFDNANHLIGIIGMFKEFYDTSTKSYFDELIGRFDLTGEDIDAYGLSVWGKILGVPRFSVTINNEAVEISDDFYRRILLGKFRMLDKEPTIPNYISYLVDVFGTFASGDTDHGNVKAIDGKDMSLTFQAVTGNNLEAEELAAITQQPDYIFSFPAGVRSSAHSNSLMFGLSTANNVAQDTFCGGLDESSFCWRYTPEGNWR